MPQENTQTRQSLKIVRLTSQNVKRLTAVEIKPDGNLVVIGGKNGAGKTSVLDSIMYALAGGKSIPSKPIRDSEKSGKIVVELDGFKRLTVERKLTSSGGTLEIRTADGFKAPSPQAILDGLCGRIIFDPLEFTRMPPAKQAETLRGLVGLDFSTIDTERKQLFEQRTQVNRDAKALKARVDANPLDPAAPQEEVSVAELMNELKTRQSINDGNKQERDREDILLKDWEKIRNSNQSQRADIARMADELAAAKEFLKHGEASEREAEEKLNAQRAKCAALKAADVEEIETRIQSAESVNAAYRQANETRTLILSLNKHEQESDRLTKEIESLDTQKESLLASAKWPISGLGFSDYGVTLNGLPFEQSSSAEQLRVSVAIGLALNPTLRVLLIRDGSLLDEDSMNSIATMAQEADAQLWIERVGEGSECSIIIEDGHIKELPAVPAA